jgi:arylsulfatase A-like enzyme
VQDKTPAPNRIRALRESGWKYAVYADPSGETEPQFELYDLANDPFELQSLHDDPAHAGVMAKLRLELERLSDEVGDTAPAAAGMAETIR